MTAWTSTNYLRENRGHDNGDDGAAVSQFSLGSEPASLIRELLDAN